MPRNLYYDGPPSRNFDGLRFFNPGEPETDRTLGEILRWKLVGAAAAWPKQVPVRQAVPDANVDALRVTMVGHATLLIQAGGLNVLTDPVWSERASPLRFVGPKRVTMPGIAFENLPKIHAILVSHNHYDHLDTATLLRLHERDAPLIVTPLGNDAIIRRHVPGAKVAAGDWGDRFEIGGTKIDIVPANHWSSRKLTDRRMALWGGFMLHTSAALVYFAGDTAYGDGRIFRSLRERYGQPDVALIPIGAYAPEWFMSAQHCTPEDAIRIVLDLEARHALGIHWGTFQLTDEARTEPVLRLMSALAKSDIARQRFSPATPGMIWQRGPTS